MPLTSFVLLAFSLSSLLSETIPQRYPLDRYDSLRKHLPFGKPTVIETEAPKPPPFTDDLTLLGFSKVGSGYFVTLSNKKTQQKIFLSPKEKPDGITIAEVINNADLNKVEIKLKKGAEIASVKFDPAFLAGPKPGTFPMPNPLLPQMNPQNSNAQPTSENDAQPQPPTTPVAGSAPNPQPSDNPNGTPPPIKRIRRVIVPTQSPGQ